MPFQFRHDDAGGFRRPRLLILPPHRLLRGFSQSRLDKLASELPSFFEIEKLPLDCPDIWQKIDAWQSVEDKQRLVLFGLDGGNFWC
jgi:hypothetical protein